MDVHSKLDELTGIVNEARSMPMSASCIVNRTEVLGLLDEVRELLPEELHHAEAVLEEREAVVDDGRREAERVLEDARNEQARLVSEQEVVLEAHRQAAQILADARELSVSMRTQTDDYVDAKLANFEVVLGKTLAAVTRGREKLRDRSELADLDPARTRGPDGGYDDDAADVANSDEAYAQPGSRPGGRGVEGRFDIR